HARDGLRRQQLPVRQRAVTRARGSALGLGHRSGPRRDSRTWFAWSSAGLASGTEPGSVLEPGSRVSDCRGRTRFGQHELPALAAPWVPGSDGGAAREPGPARRHLRARADVQPRLRGVVALGEAEEARAALRDQWHGDPTDEERVAILERAHELAG